MLSMNTAEKISICSRIFFFLTTFWSIHTGDPVGVFLSIAVFLVMENFIEDLSQATQV